MNRDELLDQLGFYRKLVEEQGDVIEGLRKSIDDMRQDNKESQNYNKKLLKQVADLTIKLDKALSAISILEKRLSDKKNEISNPDDIDSDMNIDPVEEGEYSREGHTSDDSRTQALQLCWLATNGTQELFDVWQP